MLIEVDVAGWSQMCCGEPFRVGGRARWSVVAGDPAKTSSGSPPRYHENGHQPDAEGAQWEVGGTVVRILGLTYDYRPIPVCQVMTADFDRPAIRELDRVDRVDYDTETETGADAYRVTLEVADDQALSSLRSPQARSSSSARPPRPSAATSSGCATRPAVGSGDRGRGDPTARRRPASTEPRRARR